MQMLPAPRLLHHHLHVSSYELPFFHFRQHRRLLYSMSLQATPSYFGRRSAFHARYVTIDIWESGNQHISNADQVTRGAPEDEYSSHKEGGERNATTMLHLWHLSVDDISTTPFKLDGLFE